MSCKLETDVTEVKGAINQADKSSAVLPGVNTACAGPPCGSESTAMVGVVVAVVVVVRAGNGRSALCFQIGARFMQECTSREEEG